MSIKPAAAQLGYDAGGHVISRRLRDGNSIGYTYDNLGRLIARTLPNLGGDDTSVAYTYDNPGNLLLAAKSATDQASFSYDALGRKTGEGNTFYSLAFQYDAAGNRIGMTWNDGFTVAYDHLITGEVSAIRENGATSGIGVLAAYTYDDLGRRTALTRGNGTVTSYAFDPVSRLTQLDLGFVSPGANLAVTLAYNPAGQIVSRTGSNNTYAWTGGYDVTRSYTINGLNQYTASGAVTPTYDARGNTTSAGAQTYQYTSQNRLWNAPGQTTLYADALERLDQITAESVALAYDGSNMIGEYAVIGNVGTVVKRYVFGPGTDEPLVWYDGTGTTARHWLHADERGSIIATSDDTGTSTATNTYDEFGIPAAGNVGRYQYTGQKWLPSIALYDYKARIYSPTLGRFMQTDPIGYGGGLNVYNYAHGDPVNGTDTSGLLVEFGSNRYVMPVDPTITVTGIRNACDYSAFCSYSTDPRDIAAALQATSGLTHYNTDQGGGGGGGGGQVTSVPKPSPVCKPSQTRAADKAANVGSIITDTGAAYTAIGLVTSQPEIVALGEFTTLAGSGIQFGAAVGRYASSGNAAQLRYNLANVVAGFIQANSQAARLASGFVLGKALDLAKEGQGIDCSGSS